MARMALSFQQNNFFGACAFGFFVYLAGHAVHFTGVAAGLAIFLVAKFSGMTAWWDGAWTATSTLFVGLFASLAFRPPSPKQLEGLDVGTR